MEEINTYAGKLSTYAERIMNLAVDFAPRLVIALLVVILGWFIVKQLSRLVKKALERSKVNKELRPFIISFVSIGLKILLIIIAAGIVGIETASITALIAAMSFAVGLALQGNLSNFAAGILMLIFKPFKTGDEIIVQGDWVYVKEIHIFHTILENFDKTIIIVPNSIIMNHKIQNNSIPELRGIPFKLNVPYSEDLNAIYDILLIAAHSIPEIDTSKTPFFWIQKFDDHFIRVSIQFYASQDGYWDTEVKLNKTFFAALHEHNVQIAYPYGVDFGTFGEDTTQKLSKN